MLEKNPTKLFLIMALFFSSHWQGLTCRIVSIPQFLPTSKCEMAPRCLASLYCRGFLMRSQTQKLEMLQHTKPLERNPVKLSGSGIKSGYTVSTGTYSNEHSNEILSVDCFKQIVKDLNIRSFSMTSCHGWYQ